MDMVTGAAGHIGNVLVRELLAGGSNLRVLVLAGEDLASLKGLDVEVVKGDVCDTNALEEDFRGIDTVYHLAGIISIMPGYKNVLTRTNVLGTRNVIEACLKTGVRRLVYISSIHAIKEPPHGTTITEICPFDPLSVLGDYAKSKAQASCEVLKGIERGLEAVIVCPTGVIGPFDFRVSEMGRLILDFINRRLKASVKGAYDFVDVRDVAHGIVLAGQIGRNGETYILSGERITISCMMLILESITGIKAPSIEFPAWLARSIGVLATPYYRISKHKPLFTAYSIDVLKSNSQVSSAKAKTELGFTARSARESIVDTVNWFKEQAINGVEVNRMNGKYCHA